MWSSSKNDCRRCQPRQRRARCELTRTRDSGGDHYSCRRRASFGTASTRVPASACATCEDIASQPVKWRYWQVAGEVVACGGRACLPPPVCVSLKNSDLVCVQLAARRESPTTTPTPSRSEAKRKNRRRRCFWQGAAAMPRSSKRWFAKQDPASCFAAKQDPASCFAASLVGSRAAQLVLLRAGVRTGRVRSGSSARAGT